MRCSAAASPSSPETNLVPGSIPADLREAMTPDARPSFIAYTPSNPSGPSAVMVWSISS
jgi:hypothetical protein